MARNQKTNAACHLAGLAVTAALFGVASPVLAQTLYVSNASTNTLSMVPVDTSRSKIDITVGQNPQAVAVSPDGRYAYTANASDNTVSAINTATQTVIGTWATGAQPYALAVSADGTKLYVANNGSNTVSVLNATTGSAVQSPLSVGSKPIGLTVSPDGNYLAVSHYSGDAAQIFSISGATATPYATATIGDWHYAAAFSADSATAYFPTNGGYVPFDMTSKTAAAAVATGANYPHIIAVSSSGIFYQADYLSSNFVYGDVTAAPPFATASVDAKATSIALNPTGSTLYLAFYGTHGDTNPGFVRAYRTSDMANTISYAVGGNPSGVAYSQHDFTPAAPVPTLTEWAMILMGLVLAGFAALTLQRRRQAA